MRTKADVEKVRKIIDDLERLKVPEGVCLNLRLWCNKEASKLSKKESKGVGNEAKTS